MVLELCEDNAGLLSSVTVLYLNTDKDEHKEEELISILSKLISLYISLDFLSFLSYNF